jgi:hypothetical protein
MRTRALPLLTSLALLACSDNSDGSGATNAGDGATAPSDTSANSETGTSDAPTAPEPAPDVSPDTANAGDVGGGGAGDTGSGGESDVSAPDDTAAPPSDTSSGGGGGASCDPARPVFCAGGRRFRCDPETSQSDPDPCPTGEACIGQGQCVAIQGNVLLLVDTSSSMNAIVGRDMFARDCVSAGCPVWAWPQCDDPTSPQTRIARVKVALQRIFGSEEASGVRWALQRFPQKGDSSPDCDDGYNWGLRAMTDHGGQTSTSLDGWFGTNLAQVIAVPFSDAASPPLDALNRWVDFEETGTSSSQACSNNWDCASNICQAGRCFEVDNPELRGVGFTPIGKSLFYAGEYFRHRVLVQGKTCSANADCGSPHHSCVEGKCHDPLHACRPNVVVVLTDGGETEDRDPATFFHPRVQAKRMNMGLGCSADSDCAGRSTCVSGSCQPVTQPYQPTDRMCSVYGIPCASANDCIAPCTNPAQCPVTCGPAVIAGATQGPAGRITDYTGRPVSLTVHVVDASNVQGGNADIAAYGGGVQIGVDLADIDSLVNRLRPLLDTKLLLARCPELSGN